MIKSTPTKAQRDAFDKRVLEVLADGPARMAFIRQALDLNIFGWELNNSLQRLRRAGRIVHDSAVGGWRLSESATPMPGPAPLRPSFVDPARILQVIQENPGIKPGKLYELLGGGEVVTEPETKEIRKVLKKLRDRNKIAYRELGEFTGWYVRIEYAI